MFSLSLELSHLLLESLWARPAPSQWSHPTKWPLTSTEEAVTVLGLSHLWSAEPVFALLDGGGGRRVGNAWGSFTWVVIGEMCRWESW